MYTAVIENTHTSVCVCVCVRARACVCREGERAMWLECCLDKEWREFDFLLLCTRKTKIFYLLNIFL
jgi:hypothetical protein